MSKSENLLQMGTHAAGRCTHTMDTRVGYTAAKDDNGNLDSGATRILLMLWIHLERALAQLPALQQAYL